MVTKKLKIKKVQILKIWKKKYEKIIGKKETETETNKNRNRKKKIEKKNKTEEKIADIVRPIWYACAGEAEVQLVKREK